MKAFFSTAFGGPEVSFYGELPDPSPGIGQLLVEVIAVSLNAADIKIKRGDLKSYTGSVFPKILGSDFAGIVKEVGPGTTGFNRSDRIYGMTSVFTGKPGALAELLTVDKVKVRPVPAGMTFEEAAALPAASLTALNGLRTCMITAGKELLINGATGGVGHFAVQIAKALGAVVTATCSPDNAGFARKLGAHNVIGYRRKDLVSAGRKYDAILDAYGRMEYADARRLLKRGGIYASTLFVPPSGISSFFLKHVYGKRLTAANMRAEPEDYQEIERMFLEKKLYPVIENYFTLDKAASAFELAEHGKHRGKIVVTV